MMLGEASAHFISYQWLDNVKIHKYTKFEPNVPCGSNVLSIFTKRARPAKNDARWSLIYLHFRILVAGQS